MMKLALAAALTLASPEARTQDWPMYKGNPERTGFSSSPVPQAAGLAWSVDVAAQPSQPIVYDGRVFLRLTDYSSGWPGTGTLCSFDAATGQKLWSKAAPDWSTFKGFSDVLAAGEGLLLYAHTRGYDGATNTYAYHPPLVALDAATGAEVWRHPISFGLRMSEPAFVGDEIYLQRGGSELQGFPNDNPETTYYNDVMVLDAANGSLKRHWYAGRGNALAVTVADGRVFLGDFDRAVWRGVARAYDGASGARLWEKTAQWGFYSVAPYDLGTVTFGNVSSFMANLDAFTGQERWRWSSSQSSVNADPSAAYGKVYVSHNQSVLAFDAAGGALVWQAALGENAYAYDPPVLADGKTLVGYSRSEWTGYYNNENDYYFSDTTTGDVAAFDAETGAPLWSEQVGSPTALAVADGGVFAGAFEYFSEYFPGGYDSSSSMRLVKVGEGGTPTVEDLLAAVEALDLSQGVESSLGSKLSNALAALEKGHTGAAANQLEAFANQVKALSGKSIPADEADALLEAVAAILAGL